MADQPRNARRQQSADPAPVAPVAPAVAAPENAPAVQPEAVAAPPAGATLQTALAGAVADHINAINAKPVNIIDFAKPVYAIGDGEKFDGGTVRVGFVCFDAPFGQMRCAIYLKRSRSGQKQLAFSFPKNSIRVDRDDEDQTIAAARFARDMADGWKRWYTALPADARQLAAAATVSAPSAVSADDLGL